MHTIEGQSAAEDSDTLTKTIRTGLSRSLELHEQALLDLWWELGSNGPTLGSPSAGLRPVARQRYLLPLARTLRGALLGSADHLAVYLDERTRYGELLGIAAPLRVELPRVAELLAPHAQEEALAELRTLHAPLLAAPDPGIRVLFVGDCLFVEVRAFLGAFSRQENRAPTVQHVFFSARQAVDDIESSTTSAIRDFQPEVIGLSLFTFDATPLFRAGMWDNAAPWRRVDLSVVPALIGALEAEIRSIRRVTDATIVVHSPSGVPLDPVRRRLPRWAPAHSRNQRRFLEVLRAEVTDLVDASENAILLDEHSAVGGATRHHGRPLFEPRDVPEGYFHTTRLGPLLARRYSHIVNSAQLLGRAKAVFVDFDNTLWSGVMAEGPVRHDRPLQQVLRQLREAGVLLVALSKNDESSIRWEEMDLTAEDFVLRKIDWNPKPNNVSTAIAELDLAPEAFILLDDNPVERALVVEAVPGVRALDPGDASALEMLRMWLEMPSTKRTPEATRRTQLYREAAERRSVMSGDHDYAAMMRSLRLVTHIRPAVPGDLDRLLELVHRTNQFNTSTKRLPADDLRRLLTGDSHSLWLASLSDRFGDVGVVALCIFDRVKREIDSFIMSCRAMGFAVETALLHTVIQQESLSNKGPVLAPFIPTERNGPAAGLYRDHGFEQQDPGMWLLSDPERCHQPPAWLAVAFPS